MQKKPFLAFILVLMLTIALTQFLAYQQYLILKEREHEALLHELSNVEDKFRSILYSDITAANTMALIYREYGIPRNFDSIASEVLKNSKYAEEIQLTKQGIITNIYPLQGYEQAIGLNTLADSMRSKEAGMAFEKQDIYFAGPRKLREGGVGILGKAPIVVNGELKGIIVVLTKLPTIVKALDIDDGIKNKFAYTLAKANAKNDTVDYLLTNARPDNKRELVSTIIPEGDWLLYVGYNPAHPASIYYPVELSILGLLFSVITSLFVYRRAKEPHLLKQIIESQTRQLVTSEKYFRTLIETSSDAIVLMDESGKLKYQTPSADAISGYSLQDIQNINGISLMHPDDQDGVNKAIKDLISTPGLIVNSKHRLKQKNGQYIWIEGAYRNLLHDENVNAIVFNYKNVTEINRERDRRLKTEIRLQTTMDNMPVGCKIINFSWKYTYINNEAATQAFSTKEEILGNTIFEVHPGVESSNVYAMYKKCMDERIRLSFEEQYTYTNGITGWYDFKIEPVDEGIFIMTIDITDKRRILEDILRTKHSLNERVKELSTIYQFHNILQDEEQAIDEVFSRIINLLPQGWQYPEICEARIVFNENKYTTKGYRPSDYHQVTPIQTLDGGKGFIEVVYTEERTAEAEGPFLKEERDLINTLAEIIQVYFNKKSNQDALTNSEARFRGAFEHAAIGMALVSLTGERLKVNRELCDMLGYTEQELLSVKFQQTIHPDDLEKDAEYLREILGGKKDYYREERRYIHMNGAIVWVNLNTAVIKDGNAHPLYFVAQIENITEKKAVHNELVKSEANLRSIFDNSDILYLLLDTDYNIVSYNKRMQDVYLELTGRLIDAGDNIIEMIIREKKNAAKEIYDNVVAKNTPITYETAYALKDGTKYFMAHIAPIATDGSVSGIAISSVEITKMKELEFERQKMITDLLQRNKDLQEFAQIVSHNLRGPLATILGLSNMIKESITDQDKDFILDGIGLSAEKLDAVVMELNSILNVKNASSESRVNVSLDELIEEIKGKLSNLILISKAEIRCDFREVSEIFTTRSFIYNIFFNLISNSLKYRDKSSTPDIIIWAEKNMGGILVAIKDNGVGIDMEKYGDQIFGLNKRFHNTPDGKGLGLFMVKAQVEALNGTVEIESMPGFGTTVRIILPV